MLELIGTTILTASIAVNLNAAITTMPLSPVQKLTTVSVAGLWIGFAIALATTGVYAATATPVPVVGFMVALPVIVIGTAALLSAAVRETLLALPVPLLIGLNALRVFPGAFMVLGNDSRLGQVVNNLIDNARSFSPPGGTVRVTARRLKNQIEIIVDDDGPGIPAEAMEKIFERFYTHRPHQPFGQNSGLGLSISKHIIEAHGGRIRAENRAGPAAEGAPVVLGARFTVRLPAM